MNYQSGAVSPGNSIGEGWEIIKNNYWMYVLMMLVMFVILFAVSMIIGLISNGITFAIAAVMGGVSQNGGSAAQTSATVITQIISLGVSFFTNIITLTLYGTLISGIYAALSRTASTGIVEFGDLFAGFQKIMPNFIVAGVLSAAQFGVSILLLLGGLAVGVSFLGFKDLISKNGQPNPEVIKGLLGAVLVFFLIYSIINLIISALTAFVYPLIAERGLSGGEALMLSAKSGLANIGGIILLMILLGFMALGGLLVCGIGLLFVAPILSAAMFAAYQSVFGRTEDFNRYTPPPPPNFSNQSGY